MAFKNFISIHAPMADVPRIFGDANGVVHDPVELFDPANDTIAHLLVGMAFGSVTQARKNGWDKPIPAGFSEVKVGKHTRLWIWNPVPGKGL